MTCERCGQERSVGYSIAGERIGKECLRYYEEHPEVVLRITDAAENHALSRYLAARR